MLVQTMIQEAGGDVGTKRIVWVKVNLDYEILFRLMDRLRPDTEWRYWIREPGKDRNICDIGQDTGQIATGVKIALPVSVDLRRDRPAHQVIVVSGYFLRYIPLPLQ